MAIYVPNTSYVDGIITEEDAAKWMRAHVIVKRKDLNRIKALAKKLGWYDELKALGVEMQEFSPTDVDHE